MIELTGYFEQDFSKILTEIKLQVHEVVYVLQNYACYNGIVIQCQIAPNSELSSDSNDSTILLSCDSDEPVFRGLVLEGLIVKYSTANASLKNMIISQQVARC